MDRGAWWATVHGTAKGQTQLGDLATTTTVTAELRPQPLQQPTQEAKPQFL